MKRFDEKVKDIVEVRSSSNLCDFLADPANALAGYHFTDITSDLMAKWLDRVAGVKTGKGAALALAGFRGVGKSHFLAALGAIVSQPEMRAAISDQHVAASAQQLSRRHGIVAHVRRGSADTLITELKNAIADVTGSAESDLGDSISDLMPALAAKSGDMPPVILIDTAFGRDSRVKRDDGRILSEIATAAAEVGIFVGLALDDDIAGADGINSSIASTFGIDYLDQEHLYKIVNAHVFKKNVQRQPVLHDIYESYRQSMPGFRWSEGRFSSLYPLHPAILELAPFVRLYLHDFALLGFASEAGVRILGRPANSLIGLDEVFDSIEDKLRNVADMKDAFSVYDSLDKSVVTKAPVMKRHEAKLVLKGFFLLSMAGEGVTANDVAAAMLIFDDQDTTAATMRVDALLGAFAAATPESIKVSSSSGDAKYSLRSGGDDDINTALAAAIAVVPADVIWPILRRQTAEKFSDLGPFEHDPSVSTKCTVTWRGGIRRGEILWSPSADDGLADWRVFINSAGTNAGIEPAPEEASVCEWRLGELNADDIDTLRRFHVLQTDTEFRDKFRDAISTVLHVHLIAIEKIWQRVFLEEGSLVADGTEYRFSEEARASHSLSQLFTLALADNFETRFPSHPEFGDVLQERQVSQLVEHFFSGASPAGPDVQRLAGAFGVPLGLVVEHQGLYSPLSAAELLELPVVKSMLLDAPAEKNGLIDIRELSSRMQRSPYGLTREAQHLVLAALVGQRQFEFVTSSGNRINHRSLDLQIVWDDIIGIAEPAEEAYSNERLVKWAATLSGNASLTSLDTSASRLAAIEALSNWLDEWQSSAVLERFERLPDDKLNTRLWRIAVAVKKTFGAASDAINGLVQANASLDECLQEIADAFWDSADEYQAKLRDLEVLKSFLAQAALLDNMRDYLLVCESTHDVEIDTLRADLLERTCAYLTGSDDSGEPEAEFARFKELYANWYAERHDAVMNSAGGKLDEFMASNAWATFSDLSMQNAGSVEKERAMAIIREIRSLKCAADVRTILVKQPHCGCSFALPDVRDANVLIDELNSTVAAATLGPGNVAQA